MRPAIALARPAAARRPRPAPLARARLLVLFLLALALALLALLAPALARAAPPGWVTHPGDPLAVHERRLDNGLTVLVSVDPQLPRVFGAVVVRAGGRHDPQDATGAAHLLEHMLFKGTDALGVLDPVAERPHLERIEALYEELRAAPGDDARAAILAAIDREAQAAARHAIPGELDRILQDLGAVDVNAFTTPDITVYHSEFPARGLDRWLAVHAERFRAPVFRLFPSELESVYEEKNRAMDGLDPIADAFLARFFPGHPYGQQSVLGSAQHLRSPSLRALRDFHRRHYVAGNMALILVGDLDLGPLGPLLDRLFSTWPQGHPDPAPLAPPAPLRGRQAAAVRVTPVRALGLGFHLPPPGHPDHPAVMVASELLSNPQGAGLVDRLGPEGAVLYAQSVPIPLDERGVGLVAAVPRLLTQSFAAAERRLLAAIDRLRRGDFTDDQLAAARRALADRERIRWETLEGRALALAEAFGRGQPWPDALAAHGRLVAVDRAAVVAAARRYYGDDYLALRSRIGAPPKERLDRPALAPVRPAPGARSAFARALDDVPERPRPPRFVDLERAVERADLAPGAQVHRAPNPYNDLYTLELRLGLGRYDRRELWVLGDYLKAAGTADRGAQGLRDALFALATDLQIAATEEALVFRLQGPEDRLPAALDLLAELLDRPAEDRAALRRLRLERWGRARVERSQPRVIADALRERVTFGERSIYRRDYGPLGLTDLHPDDLTRALADARRHAATVRYVGARSAAEVAALVRARIDLPERPLPARPRLARPRVQQGRDRVFFVPRRGLLQAHVAVAVEGAPLTPADHPLALAYSEYLGGGMSGLVFQELRELRGLAYAVSARFHEPAVAGRPGLTLAALATRADQAVAAAALLRRLVIDPPDQPGRIDQVRNALLRAQEADVPAFRELLEVLDRWRWQGHQDDPRRAVLDALDRLDLADLRRFHAAHVAGRPVALMVVADPARVRPRDLAALGPVEVIPERRLFAP